jgi:hypothetical protein
MVSSIGYPNCGKAALSRFREQNLLGVYLFRLRFDRIARIVPRYATGDKPLTYNPFTPTRLKVLAIVQKRGGGCTAGQIQNDEDLPRISKQCVWQHLQRLEALGYLKPRIPGMRRAWIISEKGAEALKETSREAKAAA